MSVARLRAARLKAARLEAAASSGLCERIAQARIVLAPPLWVAQHLMRLIDLAEALVAAVWLVRVVHPSQAAIGCLYLVLRRLARDGKGAIVIS